MFMKKTVDSISISNKIACTFFAILILVGGLAAVSINRASSSNNLLRELVDDYVISLAYLDDMRGEAASYRSRLNRNIWSVDNEAAARDGDAALTQLEKSFYESDAAYAPTVLSEQEAALHERIKAVAADFFARGQVVRALLRDRDVEGAKAEIVKDVFPAAEALDKALVDDFALNSRGAIGDAALVTSNIEDGLHTWIFVLTAVIVFLALAGFFLMTAIAKPITALSGAMSRLAGGDNDVMIPELDRSDEVGQMAHLVDELKQKMLQLDALQGKP